MLSPLLTMCYKQQAAGPYTPSGPSSQGSAHAFAFVNATSSPQEQQPSLIIAMASDHPDPQGLETWEDAFKYPVQAVRRLETQLRSEIAGNKDRLRTLVG